jgi:alkylhydroperoxidase/carboxymuconolactone decarboxylase family protein YurZ
MQMTSKAVVSESFRAFLTAAPHASKAWLEVVESLGQASALDGKTKALCYVSVLAAARLTSGVTFHAAQAHALGASRDEVISAVLSGLPAVGNAVVESLPAALQAFEDQAGS